MKLSKKRPNEIQNEQVFNQSLILVLISLKIYPVKQQQNRLNILNTCLKVKLKCHTKNEMIRLVTMALVFILGYKKSP